MTDKPHIHSHEHGPHSHSHEVHSHEHGPQDSKPSAGGPVLTVRAASGLSGDMLLTGLCLMDGCGQAGLDELTKALNLPALFGCARLEERSVNHIAGWTSRISLPPEHVHRSLADIVALIAASRLDDKAKALAEAAFRLLAKAEGEVHGKNPEEVTFHEVGALDSILDICLASALFARLGPQHFVCSPLPLADGGVACAHGWLPTPAPAVLKLLENVPVRGFAGCGETVTPTAIALLKAFGAQFGPWPEMRIERQALVYGGKVFEGAPNGAIWALGPALGKH